MSSHEIQTALWISQPFVQALIVICLYRRRIHKAFPAFFWYGLAQILFFVVSFPIRENYVLYFDVYYVSASLNVVFAFKIIHEVFIDIFRPYPALKDLGTALFKWAAMIMVLVSVVMIGMSPGWDDPIKRTILVIERGVDLVQCGMVIFLLAFSQNLGVTWRRLSFGIALGFGFASGTELLVDSLLSGSHVKMTLANTFDLMAYSVSLLLWLAYSLACKFESAVPVLVPQRWDGALQDIQPHDEADSLIPMFEHMVEQALSKTQDQRV